MAKKEETVDMVDRFAEFKELKNIDKTTMISVLEESFRSVLAKMFGSDENFDVIMNPDKGDCEIYQNLEVVNDGEVVDPNKQISISDVHNDPENPDPDCEVGEDYVRTIDFAKFGRRAILNLRQTLASKILDLQKDAIYNKFKEMNITPVKGVKVSSPYIDESPISIECRVKEIIPLGTHHMFIADVLNVIADERFIDAETGAFDMKQANLLAYCHGQYFKIGEAIGKFGWSVKKK